MLINRDADSNGTSDAAGKLKKRWSKPQAENYEQWSPKNT